MTPDWLPDQVVTDGEWSTVLAKLYSVFCRDFKDNRPRLDGLPVRWDERSSDDGYEEGFWHLITQDNPETGERLFEPARASRLQWCWAVIRNADDPAVLKWVYREKGKLRRYLWAKDLDYVVALKAVPPVAPRYYFLVTAFHLDGPHQRRNLQRRYDNREA